MSDFGKVSKHGILSVHRGAACKMGDAQGAQAAGGNTASLSWRAPTRADLGRAPVPTTLVSHSQRFLCPVCCSQHHLVHRLRLRGQRSVHHWAELWQWGRLCGKTRWLPLPSPVSTGAPQSDHVLDPGRQGEKPTRPSLCCGPVVFAGDRPLDSNILLQR